MECVNRKSSGQRYDRSLKGKFRRAKCQAKTRKHSWNISFEDFICILEYADCHYCKGPLDLYGCSLDRKDSSKGYALKNVVPCCGHCNRVKGRDLSYQEAKVALSAVMGLREAKENEA